MRILQLISTIGYYGAERVVSGLTRELQYQKHDTVVCSLTRVERHSDEITEKATRWGTPAFDIACSGRFDGRALRTLRRLIADERIDLIHSHNYKANVYSYLATRRTRLPLVATCHNWTQATKALRLYATLDRFLLRRFDKVVAVSEVVAKSLLRSRIPEDRIGIVSNGIDVQEFETALAAVPRQKNLITIGAVCRLTPEKGIADLLHVTRTLLDQHPNIRLIVAGDGPNRGQFENLAAELGVASRVNFLGYRTDMPAVYASMDVFVLPSWNEGMPMSILEAMAAGKAVIASRVGAVPKVVNENVGVLVDAGDRNALHQALARLILREDLRCTLGKAGHRLVTTTFGLQKMTEAYLQVYQEAFERRLADTSQDLLCN